MNASSAQSNIRLLLALMASGVLTACYHPGVVVYRDSLVTVKHSDMVLNSVNVHGGERFTIQVYGHTYNNVRGGKPFYIAVPELEAIAFATQDGEENATLHIVYLSNKEHLSISLGPCGFGNFMGAEKLGRRPGDPGTNYIEVINRKIIKITTRSYSWRE